MTAKYIFLKKDRNSQWGGLNRPPHCLYLRWPPILSILYSILTFLLPGQEELLTH